MRHARRLDHWNALNIVGLLLERKDPGLDTISDLADRGYCVTKISKILRPKSGSDEFAPGELATNMFGTDEANKMQAIDFTYFNTRIYDRAVAKTESNFNKRMKNFANIRGFIHWQEIMHPVLKKIKERHFGFSMMLLHYDKPSILVQASQIWENSSEHVTVMKEIIMMYHKTIPSKKLKQFIGRENKFTQGIRIYLDISLGSSIGTAQKIQIKMNR